MDSYQTEEQEAPLESWSQEPKAFKRPNFIKLNVIQFLSLLKRNIVVHFFSPFSSILRIISLCLVLVFVFALRQAILAQSTKKDIVDVPRSFDPKGHFHDVKPLTFLVSRDLCFLDECNDGTLVTRILKKLNLEDAQVMEAEFGDLPVHFSNKSFSYMGGFALTSLTQPQLTNFWDIDYYVISNHTAFKRNAYAFEGSDYYYDIAPQIQKAITDVLAERSLSERPKIDPTFQETHDANDVLRSTDPVPRASSSSSCTLRPHVTPDASFAFGNETSPLEPRKYVENVLHPSRLLFPKVFTSDLEDKPKRGPSFPSVFHETLQTIRSQQARSKLSQAFDLGFFNDILASRGANTSMINLLNDHLGKIVSSSVSDASNATSTSSHTSEMFTFSTEASSLLDASVNESWTASDTFSFDAHNNDVRDHSDVSSWVHRASPFDDRDHELVPWVWVPIDESDTDVIADTSFRIIQFPSIFERVEGTDSLYHNLLPAALLIGLFIVAIQAHYALNHERQTKSRIAMRMMGLRQMPFWLSWLTMHSFFIATASILAILLGFILRINFVYLTNPLVLFVLLFLYGLNFVFNFFLCSICCSGSRSTNVNGFVVLFISMLMLIPFAPMLSFSVDKETGAAITMGSYFLTSPSAYWIYLFPSFHFFKSTLDISSLTQYRQNTTTLEFMDGPGFYLRNVTSSLYPTIGEVPPMWTNLFGLVVLNAIVFIFTIYLDNVVPQIAGGTSLPFYYLFLPSYWGFISKGKNNLGIDVALHRTDKMSSVLVDTDEDIYQEYQAVVEGLDSDVGDSQMMPIKVVKLSKTYTSLLGLFTGGNKTALDSLTFSCNKDQVTVLLGHNGSGKSTALNILTGIISASSGDSLFQGFSTIYNMDMIRPDLGICLQEDIIFEGLTGYQMMKLFAHIKGIPLRSVASEIKEKLNMVTMWKYRNQRATTYSGGMKRRLSLAIACIGNPRHLILDEICAGVDPSARRLIWNVLGQLKRNRSILMSTHDLYEAELIADKVVILALGRCRGIGTLQHLKSRYGGGLSIHAVSDRPEELKLKVSSMVPEVEVESEAHGSLIFNLPSLISPSLLSLFTYLEDQTRRTNQPDLKNQDRSSILLKDFVLMQTSLEQIFLRLTHGGKHGVFNQRQTQNVYDQLNIVIENDQDVLGCIDISPTTTLAVARQLMLQQIEGLSPYFVFLSNGVPLTRSQEDLKFASQLAPLAVIRNVDPSSSGSAALTDRSVRNVEQESIINELRGENATLRSELEQLRQQIQLLMQNQTNASDST